MLHRRRGLVEDAHLRSQVRRYFVSTAWLQDDQQIGPIHGALRTPAGVDIAVKIGPSQRYDERTLWKASAIMCNRCKATPRMECHEEIDGSPIVILVDDNAMSQTLQDARPATSCHPVAAAGACRCGTGQDDFHAAIVEI